MPKAARTAASRAVSSIRPASSSAKSGTAPGAGNRAIAARCRLDAREKLRTTLTAMPISHGRSDSPSGSIPLRSRHASRKVSETTSSASWLLPVSRNAR